MSATAVPVIVVAGFLGAGKTTLLNHLLTTATKQLGVRIGVLVNDFGAINIDAMLVAGQADGAVSLTNGCMCCSVEQDGLDAALATLLRPSAGIDAIVVEASGIAEPKALIRMVASAGDARMRYGGLVYVIDAPGFAALRAQHPEIDGHVAVADLVVINKIDLIDGGEANALQHTISQLNPTAASVSVSRARVDPALLFDAVVRDEVAEDYGPRQLALDELLADLDPASGPTGGGAPVVDGADNHHDHHHLHDEYVSVEFTTEEAMDPRKLAEFLQRPPAGCYRIKGLTWFDLPGHRQCHVVHGVGGFVGVTREPWSARPRATTIVAIGTRMRSDEVLDQLRAAVATNESAADKNGILHITRFLPDAG